MSDVVAVSRERHGQRTWNKAAGFGFASGEQVVVISLHEAPQLMMTLPLGFLKRENRFQFVGLLGLRPAENLWVGGDGRWLSPRMPPAVLQHYPFRLLRNADGLEILGVEESGLLPPGTLGSPLFGEDGTPASELTAILEQLIKANKERQMSLQLVATLAELDLLEPWSVQIQEEGRAHSLEGLYRVSEKKLNELSGEAFLTLRGGGLLIAYTQLLSMQHIHQLGLMAEALAKAQQRTASVAKRIDHGIISFDNL